jgi:hypothetical protein
LDTGRTTGGIFRVLEFRENHPGALAYDFRTRFNLSAFEIGDTVSWLEAAYLISQLLQDPSSRLQAAVNKWKYPVTQEWIALIHIFDLLAMANSKKKPKPHPTPWGDANRNKIGGGNLTRQQVIQQLERMNPQGE